MNSLTGNGVPVRLFVNRTIILNCTFSRTDRFEGVMEGVVWRELHFNV